VTTQGSDRDFADQMLGKRLTTAEILYYMPERPSLLQSFVWQTLDIAPEFPRMNRFLEFWRKEIDAVIHSVSISCQGVISPARIRNVQDVGRLH
jgi:uncharacterized protein Usg